MLVVELLEDIGLRTPPRGPVFTPTTRHQPSTRASSIPFARTKRAPSTLIN
jgi:hypothetical protein